MAGLSAKAIKNRIKSMDSTRQITKAMELVAASKLRAAQQRALAVKEYFDTFYSAMQDIAEGSMDFESAYLRQSSFEKPLYIVIAGDRGLAGGYNANIFRACSEIPANAKILPIGKRSIEHFKKKGFEIISETCTVAAELESSDCYSAANLVAKGFLSGEYDCVYVIYTNFKNLISQEATRLQLLPLSLEKKNGPKNQKIIYEPAGEVLFNQIVPEYLGGILYCALCKSIASEQSSRRQAMNSATKNADEIIADLDLQFNRARQGAITQEITEIVAGSNAQS